MYVLVSVHTCVFINLPQYLISFMPQCLYTCSCTTLSFLFTAWSSQVLLILETQMKCLRYTSSVTLCASKDGLKWGEVPNIMDNTIRILDLHTDLHWLMAQSQQGTV